MRGHFSFSLTLKCIIDQCFQTTVLASHRPPLFTNKQWIPGMGSLLCMQFGESFIMVYPSVHTCDIGQALVENENVNLPKPCQAATLVPIQVI